MMVRKPGGAAGKGGKMVRKPGGAAGKGGMMKKPNFKAPMKKLPGYSGGIKLPGGKMPASRPHILKKK
jgi:hypothetical protein